MNSASFVASQGHVEAYDYPLWFLLDEHAEAVKRINLALHNDAVITQAATSASRNPKAFGPFKKLLERFL